MSTPTLTTGVAAPFSLTIRGSRLTHNLLALQPKGYSFDSPNDHPEYQRPYVLPESVTLEQSADNIGGTLSFVVEEPATLFGLPRMAPHYGPWFEEGNLPDNAVVEYTQGNMVDPGAQNQTRLFVGFIDQIDIEPNGSGLGTRATVTCVSTNTILDRIIVRKQIGTARRGLAAGKVTIKAGTDQAQIKAILKLAGSLRKYGNLLIFNPGDYRKVASTGVSLPALEIQPGTLRSALESVVEAAQEKDGKRRSFWVDPATAGLAYGYAVSDIETVSPTAPWRIVDQPDDEFFDLSPLSYDQAVRAAGPTFYYEMNEAAEPALNKPISGSSTSTAGALYETSGSPIYRITGPLINQPNNYAINLNGGTMTATSSSALMVGDRTIDTWLKQGSSVRLGGADGLEIGIEGSGDYRVYCALAGITYYLANPGGTSSPDWVSVHITYRAADGVLAVLVCSATVSACTEWVVGSGLSDTTTPDPEIRVNGNGVGPIAIYPFFQGTPSEAYAIAVEQRLPSAIMPRGLRITLDHSRVVKSALLLTADSAADADTDPDPYLRSYDALPNAAGTGRAFSQRPGPRFEAVVEASTIRNSSATTRSAAVDRLARAFFTTRRKPEMGLEFTIRGAGVFGQTVNPGQRYGFNGGWRQADGGGLVYVSGWRPGQFVEIKNAALGIWAHYQIVSVNQTFEPGSFIRSFRIACESRPKNSVARLLVAE